MFDKEEKPNASKKETDGAAAVPVYAAGDAANDRFCGGCTGCANKSEAGTDRTRLKSLLEEKPELKEELDGLLSVYEISIRQNGEPVEIKDSAMTVRIPMNSHLEGYAHYQAVRVDGEPERIEAKAEDGSLVFEAGGPGRYAVLGSDTPFSVSAIIQPDPLPGDEKDGNAVYIVLLAAIPAAVLLALLLVFLYRKKRKAQDNPPAGGKDPSGPDGGNTKN